MGEGIAMGFNLILFCDDGYEGTVGAQLPPPDIECGDDSP